MSPSHVVIFQVFGGNMDTGTERKHYLNQPVTARFVRIHPVTWNRRIGMRAAVLGCRHEGECGPGFMQVNDGSACSEYISKFPPIFILQFLKKYHHKEYFLKICHQSLANFSKENYDI